MTNISIKFIAKLTEQMISKKVQCLQDAYEYANLNFSVYIIPRKEVNKIYTVINSSIDI